MASPRKQHYNSKAVNMKRIHFLCGIEIIIFPREKFNLAAQLAIRVIGKGVETYKSDKTVFHEFRDFGSIVYDQRILSFKGMDQVTYEFIRFNKAGYEVVRNLHKQFKR